MEEKNISLPVNRRKFLGASAVAICALCLPGVSGCAPQEQEKILAGVPSPWFKQAGNNKVSCLLCPKECILAPGERSLCRVRENRNGVGYTLAYGNPALVQEDPVERKPFFHVLPSSRVLSIATAGCNLSCHFCEVWDMALVKPEEIHSYQLPPEKVVAHALASRVRAVSYAFGEPVAFYEYLTDIATLAKEAGLLNLAHTAGYIQPEPLRQLCRSLDAVNVDLKSFDPVFYRKVVGGELAPVLGSLKIMRQAGIHLELTNIVIPTLNDDMVLIREMCRWIVAELGSDIPLHFARFYPLHKLATLPQTPVSTLEHARNTALEVGLKFVYIAKVIGHEGENTFCPVCGRLVIKRVGFIVGGLELQNGACKNCGAAVAGIWQ